MAKHGTGHARYSIVKTNGQRTEIWVKGRDRWALDRLINSGRKGCTPITQPAPRWSHYIWRLRGMGVEIETVTEQNFGAFPGTHGRYVLHSTVSQIEEGGEA